MAGLQPHEQRVVEERAALMERIDKLRAFIDSSPHFVTLDPADKDLLREQLVHMEGYAHVLAERIGRFGS